MLKDCLTTFDCKSEAKNQTHHHLHQMLTVNNILRLCGLEVLDLAHMSKHLTNHFV